jgi:hypothetical protein
MEIILGTPDGTGNVGYDEARLGLFGDSVKLGTR